MGAVLSKRESTVHTGVTNDECDGEGQNRPQQISSLSFSSCYNYTSQHGVWSSFPGNGENESGSRCRSRRPGQLTEYGLGGRRCMLELCTGYTITGDVCLV